MSDASAHAAHSPNLAHHFDTPKQQFESGKLGMWLFLATEVLMFGGLFCAYAIYRGNHPEIFAYGSQFLDVRWGAINTIVLIGSSFTMALAVRAAQLGQHRSLRRGRPGALLRAGRRVRHGGLRRVLDLGPGAVGRLRDRVRRACG